MKKKTLQIAIATVLGITATNASALVLNWSDGTGAGNTVAFPSTINSTPLTVTPGFPPPNPRNAEFRMIDPAGNLGGGGEKSIIDSGAGVQRWVYSAGTMSGTGGSFPANAGAFAGASPAASSNRTLEQDAPFFGSPFNFLAPIAGSNAAIAYGAGTTDYSGPGDANFSLFFPVLEAQWGGTYFPLGLANGGAGITFTCVGAVNVRCTAEHTIVTAAGEDPGGAGFDGWTAQWDLNGTIQAVPVPAAVWLFGSGLLGLVGVARRRKSA